MRLVQLARCARAQTGQPRPEVLAGHAAELLDHRLTLLAQLAEAQEQTVEVADGFVERRAIAVADRGALPFEHGDELLETARLLVEHLDQTTMRGRRSERRGGQDGRRHGHFPSGLGDAAVASRRRASWW
jgi:hypothetical protein